MRWGRRDEDGEVGEDEIVDGKGRQNTFNLQRAAIYKAKYNLLRQHLWLQNLQSWSVSFPMRVLTPNTNAKVRPMLSSLFDVSAHLE
jgi:hypothetical protein